MSVLEKIALGVGGLFMLLGVLRLARSPLKLVFRVAGNAALGFGALWLLGRLAPGLQLGLNLFNGLLIGVLGLPGFGLLLLLPVFIGSALPVGLRGVQAGDIVQQGLAVLLLALGQLNGFAAAFQLGVRFAAGRDLRFQLS